MSDSEETKEKEIWYEAGFFITKKSGIKVTLYRKLIQDNKDGKRN